MERSLLNVKFVKRPLAKLTLWLYIKDYLHATVEKPYACKICHKGIHLKKSLW